MENISTAGITAEQGQLIIEGIEKTNNFIAMGIVVAGIVLSFVIARLVWRVAFKPILRDYMKFPL